MSQVLVLMCLQPYYSFIIVIMAIFLHLLSTNHKCTHPCYFPATNHKCTHLCYFPATNHKCTHPYYFPATQNLLLRSCGIIQ
jgi:hypothetical protein